MKVAIVGATGLVGGELLRVLEEHRFPLKELIPVASASSQGKSLRYLDQDHPVCTVEKALELRPDIALFSAGSALSKEYAPQFAQIGTRVVDNSSAWRMDPQYKLIVPEVNGHLLEESDYIIANPNCSTIQMVLVLNPLHQKYQIKRVVVSTYQSVTGTGKDAVEQLMAEREGKTGQKVYPHPIDLNALPHIDVFLDNDYTREEMKMVRETQKIMQDERIRLTATAVRLPVMGGHSEAVNVEFAQDFTIEEVRQVLAKTPGLIVQDNPAQNEYPMPLFAHGKDEVFVGRIRRDESHERALNLWIVADNLRKGAATNAVQIAELLLKKFY